MVRELTVTDSIPVSPAFQRLTLLTGLDAAEALARSRVIVFGVGGVGSWCAEALVRSGIGNITLVDSDAVCVTNINRQVQATSRTVGLIKTEALAARLKEINPACAVTSSPRVFSRQAGGLEETAREFGIPGADYCIDAIDSLTHKLDIIETASAAGVTLFSSMGMAQKLDPTQLKTAGIWETEGCPLARLVRQGLKKRGFAGHFTAVYSAERLPLRNGLRSGCGTGTCLCPAAAGPGGVQSVEWCGSRKVINGSAVPVTAAAGMILASLVIRDVYARYTQ